MQNQLPDIAKRLNKIHQIFERAKKISRPYRLSRIRRLYEAELREAEKRFEIQKLEFHYYHKFFKSSDLLLTTLRAKTDAINRGEYELGVALKDKEKRIVRKLLVENGYREDDVFFHYENVIYHLH